MKTIELKFQDFTLVATGRIIDGEPAVHYPVDDAYPGSADEFEIESIELIGDLFEFMKSGLTVTDIINLFNEQL